MTVDPRPALDRFIAALEAHLNAVTARRDDDDPAVDDAYYVLADAFEVYDEALAITHGEATPFYLAEDEDDDDDDDDADDDESEDDSGSRDDDDDDDEDEADDDLDSDDDLEGLTAEDIATLVDPERG